MTDLRYKSISTAVGKAVVAALLALLMLGCKVGPKYKRPVLDMPATYRETTAPSIETAGEAKTIAADEWPSVFKDPTLEALIKEALANNLDLKVAATRILQAQAQLGITRSQQFPTVSGGGSYSAIQFPSALAGNNSDGTPAASFFNGGGPTASAAWSFDFWGLYRHQTEAARAEMLASVWGQRATQTTLIATVAASYFQMRSLDEQLEMTKRTIAARLDSLNLTEALEKGGAASMEDQRQAEELLQAAQANLPEIRRQISVQENTLSVLLGKAPTSIDRGVSIDQQRHPLTVPVGLPSELLERRPDIQQAEQKLVAANARIGVARALYFPQISLTSMGGAASNQLTSIFSGPSSYWIAAGSVTQPIFDAGRIRNNYRLSKAQEDEMLLSYRKAVLSALRDVSDALASYHESHERRDHQKAQVTAATDAVRLARLRYIGGNTSYLEVLTTDTQLYAAQLQLAQVQQQEATSLVQLYAALGGGWQ